jgi:hypothetical protein
MLAKARRDVRWLPMSERFPLEYQSINSTDSPEGVRRSAKSTALTGLIVNLVSTGFICIACVGLWWVPPGAGIRPMVLLSCAALNVLFNAVVGCSSGITAAWQGRRHLGVCSLGLVTTLLGLTVPAALPYGIIRFIITWHGLVIS